MKRTRTHYMQLASVAALAVLGGLVASTGCGAATPAKSARESAAEYQLGAGEHTEAELGQALLAQLFLPGGSAKGSADLRKRLGNGNTAPAFRAALGRALYDEAHGDPGRAAHEFVQAAFAAADDSSIDTPVMAWYAMLHAISLRGSVTNLYSAHEADLDRLRRNPGNIGWRAHSALVEWQLGEEYKRAKRVGADYERYVVQQSGCVQGVRLAGPFGRGAASDRKRSFAAESSMPWPANFDKDDERGQTPHVLKVEQPRCLAAATEKTEDGVFYAEAFIGAAAERDLLIVVQGALTVWVDDAPILTRDPSHFGEWQRYGGLVHVGPGRHRITAKLLSDSTVVRVLDPNGVAASLTPAGALGAPYGLSAVRVEPGANPLEAYVAGTQSLSGLVRPFAAFGAHSDGLDDLASTWMEPLCKEGNAAPLALEFATFFAHGDAAFNEDGRKRAERAFHTRAAAADPGLWYPRLWLAVDNASQRGAVDSVNPMRALSTELPKHPAIQEQLAQLYSRLGWKAERLDTLRALSTNFPDYEAGQQALARALEEEGSLAEADALSQRLAKLNPDSELVLSRALAAQDYRAAIAELERMQRRRPERKELPARIAEILRKSGDPRAAIKRLEEALTKSPEDAELRLRLADSAYAAGDKMALRSALAAALAAGSKGRALRDAVELLEGATALDGFRRDSKSVIADFENWEKQGHHMEGSAARVLDYSTLWINSDGSSLMLEHEIQKIQSQEAIGREAEQDPPTGIVLRMRVIKPNGQILEPEPVAGKPTLTLPHLEIGDYLDIEHITEGHGDKKGLRYRGPTWFFREASKGYWRSEFIVVAPKDREIIIETRGNVPKPTLKERGLYTERRWLVEESPPAIEEPNSPPASEFLPSVRVGWGVAFASTVRNAVDAAADDTPLDPRLAAQVRALVAKVPSAKIEERAKLVYRDVLTTVEEGKESNGRRVLTSKAGSREAAFLYAMRLLGITVELAVVKNRLAAAPLSALSEADPWDSLLLRLKTENGYRWLTVRDKFAPFGYVPADVRGQPAIMLIAGTPNAITDASGADDGIAVSGRLDVRREGGASGTVRMTFSGKLAIAVRNLLERLPKEKLSDFAETRLLGGNIPGARVRDLQVENQSNLDAPVILKMNIEVAEFVRKVGSGWVQKALFPAHLSELASLRERQTPLLLGASSATALKLQIVYPAEVRMPASLPSADLKDADRRVRVSDVVEGQSITLDRSVMVPAGRIGIGAPYTNFANFTRDADAALEREIALGAP